MNDIKYAIVHPYIKSIPGSSFLLKKRYNYWVGVFYRYYGHFIPCQEADWFYYYENDEKLINAFDKDRVTFLTENDFINNYFDKLIERE
jgi:hypothetical protein